jgi:hypothetical protein
MAEESPPTVASLQADIDMSRATYAELRRHLEADLGRLYDNPGDVADELLSQADEFGQEHAVAAFAERPHEFGHVRELAEYPWPETAERAGEELARMVDAHDRLDHLTLQREALLKREDPTRLPVVNIQGREFTIDEAGRELRPTDAPQERHALHIDPVDERSLATPEVDLQRDQTQERTRRR